MPVNSVQIGLFAPPMKEQHPVLDDDTAEHFDRDSTALFRLAVRGLITDSAKDRAARKLVKNIEAEINRALKRS